MSDTIQMRQYTARQAVLLQKRPSALVRAAENVIDVLDDPYQRPSQVVYAHPSIKSENMVATSGAGHGMAVTLLNTALPTTSPELLEDLEEFPVDSSWTRWAGQVKEALRKAASKERRQTTAAAHLRTERLAVLQAAFGFTIQDLAAVLGVTRPQIYKWLDAANDIKLQEASRARLATAERIAKEWTSRCAAPLSGVSREPLNAGGTVFAMLSADAIDEAGVIAAFNELVAKLQEKPKSRSQRLREAGFTRRPSIRSLPSDE